MPTSLQFGLDSYLEAVRPTGQSGCGRTAKRRVQASVCRRGVVVADGVMEACAQPTPATCVVLSLLETEPEVSCWELAMATAADGGAASGWCRRWKSRVWGREDLVVYLFRPTSEKAWVGKREDAGGHAHYPARCIVGPNLGNG
jgi:hypothetical protein